MKGFRRLFVYSIAVVIIIIICANIILFKMKLGDEGRPYRVEAERIIYDIEHGKEPDLSQNKYVKSFSKMNRDLASLNDFVDRNTDYIIKEINGSVYRFDYLPEQVRNFDKTQIVMNIVLGAVLLFVILLLVYIRLRIIGPFNKMTELPSELAKGNITAPIKAEKNKYFGNFIWGLNLLRDRLEKGKQKDLETKKNNQSLILSLSHDIKTPLSIIELNSKALERGLYDNDKEKKDRIAVVINEKCGEIKNYVDQIITASKEDFLELEVDQKEFYLKDIVDSIREVYSGKLELLNIRFNIEEFPDCLLKGDEDRAVEVLQNLMENAVKYGDQNLIELKFSREENSQLISVTNTGCSLNDTELPHIFDSFWRGSNTGSNQGSGLGLYICKQLMNRMNGEIFAEINDGKMIVTAVFEMA